MVVFSLLLIVISGGLLVMGIVGSNDMLVIGSIALSLIAAITLFIGVWRQRGRKNPPSSAPEKSQRATPELAAEPTRRLELPAGGTGEATGTPKPSQTGQFGKRPDRTAWARSAVASIAKQQPDTPDFLAKDRPSAVPDPATAIPQLVSSNKAVEETPAAPTEQDAEREAPPVQSSTPPAELPPPPPAGQLSEVDRAPSIDDWRVSKVSSVTSDAPAMESPMGTPTEPPSTYTSETFAADPVVTSRLEEPPVDPLSGTSHEDPLAVSNVESDQSSAGDGYTDPVDEPPAELLLSYEERQLAECDREVFVIDGRPRFHLADCPHLSDKSGQPLVISEAAELGFTSCSLCTAATTVLAERK